MKTYVLKSLRPESSFRIAPKLVINQKNDNDVTILWHDGIVNFFDVVLFLLSILVTGPSFMSISSLVLELWQFFFRRDWPGIQKSEIPPSEFSPVSEDWVTFWTPNIARMSNRIFLNAAKCQGYGFYSFWVIKEKPTGGDYSPPSRLGLSWNNVLHQRMLIPFLNALLQQFHNQEEIKILSFTLYHSD